MPRYGGYHPTVSPETTKAWGTLAVIAHSMLGTLPALARVRRGRRRTLHTRRGERGISLVECLLGLFILAVVLLTLCNLFFAARKEIRSGGVDALLASSARAQIESLKQEPFDRNLAGGDLDSPVTGYYRTVEPSEGRRVLLLWKIADIDPDELKQISVRAFPLQGRGLNAGRPRELLLETYRARTSDATTQP
jgi:hypothetical protein